MAFASRHSTDPDPIGIPQAQLSREATVPKPTVSEIVAGNNGLIAAVGPRSRSAAVTMVGSATVSQIGPEMALGALIALARLMVRPRPDRKTAGKPMRSTR